MRRARGNGAHPTTGPVSATGGDRRQRRPGGARSAGSSLAWPEAREKRRRIMREERARKAKGTPPLLPRIIASLGILFAVILLFGAIVLIGFAQMIPATFIFFAALGLGFLSVAAFYNSTHKNREAEG